MLAVFLIASLAVWVLVEHQKTKRLRRELEDAKAANKELTQKLVAAESFHDSDDLDTMRLIRKALDAGEELGKFSLGGTENE